jgi:peptidoglycan/xylan/chitin deacetylase (PgdA/CDA1 family)
MTRLTIVHYHRFHQPLAREGLAMQCDYLTQAYDVVSMDEAIATLNAGADRTEPMAVVCVDDGHLDFHAIAFPVFRDHGINAICYLVTDFVDGTDWLWCDKVNFLFARTDTLPPSADRARAARMVKEQLKRLPNRDRVEQLRELPQTLGVTLPAEPPDAYRAITWTQAREMRAAGMSFGVHTRTHPILSRLSERELVNEIVESRERCEAALGAPAGHFCYPNGRA